MSRCWEKSKKSILTKIIITLGEKDERNAESYWRNKIR